MLNLGVFSYQFQLSSPFEASHERLQDQKGLWVCLENPDTNHSAWGECVPMPRWGTESLERADLMLRRLARSHVNPESFPVLPDTLSATKWALYSALRQLEAKTQSALPSWEGAESEDPTQAIAAAQKRVCFSESKADDPGQHAVTYLLRNGAPQTEWEQALQRGFRSFKLKIGVESFAVETAYIDRLLRHIPEDAHLILDANGSLCHETGPLWLEWMTDRKLIRYLEQPLAADRLPELIALSHRYPDRVAIDEGLSVDSLKTCQSERFEGYYIVKPHLIHQLSADFLTHDAGKIVYSCGFETLIGVQAFLSFLPNKGLNPIGLGALTFIPEAYGGAALGPYVSLKAAL